MNGNTLFAGICIVTVTLLASACGSVSYYVQPPATGNALLELSLAEKSAFAMFRDGRDCSGGLTILRDSSRYKPKDGASQGERIVITANKDFAFKINDDAIYSFFPEPNARYRARITELVIERKVSFMTQKHSIWTATVTRLDSDNSTTRSPSEPSFQRRAPRGVIASINEPHCRPL
jgi:hypothetical protein